VGRACAALVLDPVKQLHDLASLDLPMGLAPSSGSTQRSSVLQRSSRDRRSLLRFLCSSKIARREPSLGLALGSLPSLTSALVSSAFTLLYKSEAKLHRLSLGRYPELSLAAARGKAFTPVLLALSVRPGTASSSLAERTYR
jgi:hypothetical protein